MNLYRLNEVPDPDGQLADLLDELIDNGALVPAVGACPVCGGSGIVTVSSEWATEREHLEGLAERPVECPACGGSGLDLTRYVEAACDVVANQRPPVGPATERKRMAEVVAAVFGVLGSDE